MYPVVDALLVSPPAPVWGAQIYLLNQLDGLRERGVNLSLGTTGRLTVRRGVAGASPSLVELGLHQHLGLRVDGSSERPESRDTGQDVGRCRRQRAAPRLGRTALRHALLLLAADASRDGTRRSLSRTPVALDLVDLVRPGMGQRILRTAARLATLTVANSTATASLLGSAGPVRIIHPGIDLDRFHPGAPPASLRTELTGDADCALVGVVGRLDEGKGIHVLVDAMANSGRVLDGSSRGRRRQGHRHDRLRRPAPPSARTRCWGNGCASSGVETTSPRSCEHSTCSSWRGRRAVRTDGAGGAGLTDSRDRHRRRRSPRVRRARGERSTRPAARCRASSLVRSNGCSATRHCADRIVDEAERRANPARGLEAQYDELGRMYHDVATRAVRHD